MREHQHGARFQIGRDLRFIDAALQSVGYQHHDDISLFCRFGNGEDI